MSVCRFRHDTCGGVGAVVVGVPWQLHALAERCRVYKTLVPPLQVSAENAVRHFSVVSGPGAKKAVEFMEEICQGRKRWLRDVVFVGWELGACRWRRKPSARWRRRSTSCERACCPPPPICPTEHAHAHEQAALQPKGERCRSPVVR